MKKYWAGLFALCFGCGIAAATVTDHGVGSPVSNPGGVVATANRAGQDLAVAFLADASGGAGALVVNIETRRSTFVPFPGHRWNMDNRAFASLLSRANRYYTAFGNRFYEFDPETMTFTFAGPIDGRLGMGMCEDADGIIYVNSYPAGNITSFDPKTRKLREHGAPKNVNYAVYCRYMACDDNGWIYCGNGNTEAEIQAFHPRSGKFQQIFPAGDDPVVAAATCEVRRGRDGKVYGRTRGKNSGFYRLLADGRGRPAQAADWPDDDIRAPEAAITGSQSLFYRHFPSGRTLQKLDLLDRRIVVRENDGTTTAFAIEYPSEGAYLAAVTAMPDGTLRGGTFHPMRYFVFDIGQNRFVEEGDAVCQWNALCVAGDHLLIGGYGHGILIDWDTTKPMEKVSLRVRHSGNPRTYGVGGDFLHRPAGVVLMPGGRQIVMSGSPGYGRTGGGLAVYDVETRKFAIIPKEDVLGDFSGSGLLALSETEILLGTSRAAGTGGRNAKGDAELVIFDTVKRQVVWRNAPLPGAASYRQFLRMPNGKILGIAGEDKVFVWDPERRKIEKIVSDGEPVVVHQGTRGLLCDGKRVIVLFRKAVAEYMPETGKLRTIAPVPQRITAGGALADGRVWFVSQARLLSVPY